MKRKHLLVMNTCGCSRGLRRTVIESAEMFFSSVCGGLDISAWLGVRRITQRSLCFFTGIVVFVLCSVGTGCNQSVMQEMLVVPSMKSVVVMLPAYPSETHPRLTGWIVKTVQEGKVDSVLLSATERSVRLKVPKNKAVPVLCYPIVETQCAEDVAFFHPAGCVVTTSTEATWTGGFVAEILFTLLLRQDRTTWHETEHFCSMFNWNRLGHLVLEKETAAVTEGKVFSPWFLDKHRILADISSGKFSARSVKSKDMRELCVSLPFPDSCGGYMPYKKEQYSDCSAPGGVHSVFMETLDTTENLAGSCHSLFPRYVPQALPDVALSGAVFSSVVGLVRSSDSFTVNIENAFLWHGSEVHFFVDKNDKTTLVTTDFERYTDSK